METREIIQAVTMYELACKKENIEFSVPSVRENDTLIIHRWEDSEGSVFNETFNKKGQLDC